MLFFFSFFFFFLLSDSTSNRYVNAWPCGAALRALRNGEATGSVDSSESARLFVGEAPARALVAPLSSADPSSFRFGVVDQNVRRTPLLFVG